MSLPQEKLADAGRILVRGVNWLGDAVMTTPALMRLREAYPKSHITLLTPEKLRDLYDSHPAIDEVEIFSKGEGVLSIGRRLKKHRFDLGIVLPNSPRSAMEVWLSGARTRLGYGGNFRGVLLTKAIARRGDVVEMRKRSIVEINSLIAKNGPSFKYPVGSHQSLHYLELLGAVGCDVRPVAPCLRIADSSVEKFKNKFGLHTPAGETEAWLGLNPGAEYGPAKRWPEERFISTAIEVQRKTGCRWLVFGIKADAALTGRIAAAINQSAIKHAGNPAAINLAGATTLGELCAGLKLCRVVLTNDSGPMHVAAALGTPVVVPFGSTSPELTGPGLSDRVGKEEVSNRISILRADASCAPCFLRECPVDFRCMLQIDDSQAIRAILGHFDKFGGRSA
jgi:heptosyltransferase-2